MTNIEFLVNELRIAKETLQALKEENKRLANQVRKSDKLIQKLSAELIKTNDFDALAIIRDKLSNI